MKGIEKGFKYRIYPKKSQIEQIETMFNAKRYVWNYFLNINKYRLKRHKRVLNYHQMSALLTILKRKNTWLKQCEKSVMQNALKAQYETFLKFFKGDCGFPKFKSYKNNHQSIKISRTSKNIEVIEKEPQYTSTGKYKKQNCRIKLPKVKLVKIAYSRKYEGKLVSATLSRDTDGKYYISICCVNIPKDEVGNTDAVVGIDLGINEFGYTSNNRCLSSKLS